jgi:hypothetical protein
VRDPLGALETPRRDLHEQERGEEERGGVDPVDEVRAGEADDRPRDDRSDRRRPPVRGLQQRRPPRKLLVRDEVRHPREDRGAEEGVRDARDRGQQEDVGRASDERQEGEDGQPREVGADEEGLARQPVDERSRREPDDDRRQHRHEEKRAHPPCGARSILDVDGQRDRGHPGPERRSERRDEEQAEA